MVRIKLQAALLPGVLLLCSASLRAEVTSFSVKPSLTDPAIKGDDNNHWVYINRDIVVDHKEGLPADRHELFLWLTGTGGKGHDAQALANTAADLGYHVITLMYPDEIAANQCSHDDDPRTFALFRRAILQGGKATYQNGTKELIVDRADSIESRLIKLLQHLQEKRPKEQWNQFLTPEGGIKWETLAVGGHSQGGGHAAFIGVHHPVERVLCFGAPKDYNQKHRVPAPWYRQKLATPADHFFAFNHHQDANSCTPEEMLANMQALGMDTFGSPADVDKEQAPYRHVRILYTSFPVVTITGPDARKGIATAHSSVVQTKYEDRWKPVWTYMLTEGNK